MRSLKARLLGLWCLSLLSSLVLGALVIDLYRQSAEARIGRAQAELSRACDLIADRYAFYVTGWTGPVDTADPALRRDLVAAVDLALLRQNGIEGGIWSQAGSMAYGFPTYEGSGPKTDVPAAEIGVITELNDAAAQSDRSVSRTVASRSQTLLMAACPLGGPLPGATAWAMTRIQANGLLGPLQIGLPVLLVLLILTSALLLRTMLVWGRHVRGIERALAGADAGLPALARPGERELDRIVDALNRAGARLAEARREREAMADRVAKAERLAGLGRVAAGVAHEIRNPLAAARLQGENALAGDDARRREAIGDMLVQLDRLDGLVSELLAMTQRVQPAPKSLPLRTLLDATARQQAAAALSRGVSLAVQAPDVAVTLDPSVVGRILDNLLANAIRHASDGGAVTLSGVSAAGRLTLLVSDDGDGVAEDVVAHLFEPFVTGRADGTGLGLAIARELADAHGGRLLLRHRGGDGAATEFALELPQ